MSLHLNLEDTYEGRGGRCAWACVHARCEEAVSESLDAAVRERVQNDGSERTLGMDNDEGGAKRADKEDPRGGKEADRKGPWSGEELTV